MGAQKDRRRRGDDEQQGHCRCRKGIAAENIGRTWLNTVIKGGTVFWWGGNGVGTEHTAFLNLKRGISAPLSGSIATNGKTIAEQIGGQIFIDGFAMAVPRDPKRAARLAGAAASVSHDGEAVHAARLWAAMEAEAFASADVDHLLDTGLKFVPPDSLIAAVVADVRAWRKKDSDWMKTRERIEEKYGYDKFRGFSHVVPNHAVMILALLYGGHDFNEAMHVVNTCGWDTDCNAGNVGCLVALMHGLKAFEFDGESESGGSRAEREDGDGRYDWRGPLADRVLISSADGGYSVNNAARIAYDIANLGRKLAGEEPFPPPKGGAQFHFSLPGSVQGFQVLSEHKAQVAVTQGLTTDNRSGLAIRISDWAGAEMKEVVEVMTDTFAPPEALDMDPYEFVGSPLVYPGQTLTALVRAESTNTACTQVSLAIRVYTANEALTTLTNNPVSLAPGRSAMLEWTIPKTLAASHPVQAIGVAISNSHVIRSSLLDGTIWLDHLAWGRIPTLRLEVPTERDAPMRFYKLSFVNGADFFDIDTLFQKFIVSQDQGEGLVSYGTREWTDYRVVFRDFTINRGFPAGVVARARGLNRYYGLFFDGGSGLPTRFTGSPLSNSHGNNDSRRVVLAKALDEQRIELASAEMEWDVDIPYTIALEVRGDHIRAQVGDTLIEAHDAQFPGGGIGMVATDGSVLVGSIDVGPLV
ncbi:ADP-ribosylglycohydrolase [Hypomontagnella monticulosa]|nr:ADP-ribosylglycohydrolase [Hypomontagnella monticulosa]